MEVSKVVNYIKKISKQFYLYVKKVGYMKFAKQLFFGFVVGFVIIKVGPILFRTIMRIIT